MGLKRVKNSLKTKVTVNKTVKTGFLDIVENGMGVSNNSDVVGHRN
jgi:hypothetical protein